MAELELHADGDFEDEKEDENKIEFFYHPGKMECPIVGCDATHFAAKQKYQRHWDAKHLFYIITYFCSMPLCKGACRRKTDMKFHLKKVHEIRNEDTLKSKLAECRKETRQNPLYIDPGFLIYKGRTKVPTTSTSTVTTTAVRSSSTTPTLQEPEFIVSIPPKASSTNSTTKRPPLLPLPGITNYVPDTTPFTLTSRISLTEYKSRCNQETSVTATSSTATSYAQSGHSLLGIPASTSTTVCPVANVSYAHSGHPPPTNTTIASTTVNTLDDSYAHSGHSLLTLSGASTVVSSVGNVSYAHSGHSVLAMPPIPSTAVRPVDNSASNTFLGIPIEQTSSSGCNVELMDLDLSSHHDRKTTSDSNSQSTSQELPPITLPPIPTGRHELENYILWLCNTMDQVGRTRELAKQRLEEIRSTSITDKEAIRRLETENRELQRQIAEYKWKERFRSMDK